MNVYLITFKCYNSIKIIADNIIEAINKYQAFCMKHYKDSYNKRLDNMTSIKYLENFDYIQ